jgi:hypothetical protein
MSQTQAFNEHPDLDLQDIQNLCYDFIQGMRKQAFLMVAMQAQFVV